MRDILQNLEQKYPGRAALINTVSTVVLARSPSFTYVHDPFTFQQTRSLLSHLILESASRNPTIKHAVVDCAQCFSPRLLFTSVLNGLADFKPTWADGYKSWTNSDDSPIDGTDSFLHALQSLLGGNNSGEGTQEKSLAVIVFVNPESLRVVQQSLLYTMTRLNELTGCDISSIFLSKLQWEVVHPTSGSLPQPFLVTNEPLKKEDIVENMLMAFSSISTSRNSELHYSPTLTPLYRSFVEVIVDVCSPFTDDLTELAYVAAARWPGFVSPVIEEWKLQPGQGQLLPPSEDERLRLIRLFSSSFAQAVECLYPRACNAEEWCERNTPIQGFRLSQIQSVSSVPLRDVSTSSYASAEDVQEYALPRVAQFVLVASFLASHNPAKTDLRMLGHAHEKDGKRPRKKKQGATRLPRPGAVAKVSQHLLGPNAFPLERLLAIVGVLLVEHDEDARKGRNAFFSADHDGMSSEVEISRFLTLSAIQELVSMRLLVRTTPPERTDASSMYKCAISYERALALARHLDVSLNDLMWETH